MESKEFEKTIKEMEKVLHEQSEAISHLSRELKKERKISTALIRSITDSLQVKEPALFMLKRAEFIAREPSKAYNYIIG
jgi:primosomal protein N'